MTTKSITNCITGNIINKKRITNSYLDYLKKIMQMFEKHETFSSDLRF